MRWFPLLSGFQGALLLAGPCDPSASTRALFQRMDSPDFTGDRAATLERAIQVHRRDVPLHHAYQDLNLPGGRDKLISRYAASPADPVALYLLARSKFGWKTPEAIQHLRKALRLRPAFPWPHLLLAEIHASPNFRDDLKSRLHWAAFRKACSSTPAWWRTLHFAPDPLLRAEMIQALRTTLSGRRDLEALRAWGWLWQFEMAITRSDQRAAIAERARTELALLAGIEPKGLQWAEVQEQASWALDDQSIAIKGREQMAALYPNSKFSANAAHIAFYRQYPSSRWASPEAAAAAKAVAEKWPNDIDGAHLYWRIVNAWKAAPTAVAQDAASHLALLFERNPGAISTSPPPQTDLAAFIVERGLNLDAVPPLVHQALARAEAAYGPQAQSDLHPPAAENRLSMKENWYLMSYFPLAEAYVGMRNVSSASDILSQARAILDRRRPGPGSPSGDISRHAELEALYWYLAAGLLERKGEPGPAMEAYQRSLALFPPRRPRPDRRDEVMSRARVLWRQLGRDEQDWNLWAGALPAFNAGSGPINAWKVLASKRPGFVLKDMHGTVWDPAELQSKTTFINYWATWCLPCRDELPYLEKLIARLKDHPGVAVIVLNVDDDPTLAAPFLNNLGIRVPSVAARDFAYDFLPAMALPSNWIVKPDSSRLFYTGAAGDAWVEQVLAALTGPDLDSLK